MSFDHQGVAIGIGLLLVVAATTVLLAWKAARSADRFRDDNHERFQGRP